LLLLSTAGVLACSSTDSAPGASAENGTSALAAGAGVSMTDSQACIITTSTPAGAGDPTRTYVWRSYLAEQRIVRDIAIDAQGKPLAYDAPANTSTYAKLDTDGHMLVRALEAGGGELQRFDFARDRHGNIISYRELHTAHRDLEAPAPEAPSVAYDFVNHYSTDGLLEKHNRADSSGSTDYRHDADGRCLLILADDGIEHRDYDGDGRLSAQIFGPMDPDAPTDPATSTPSSVTTHRYDDRGRPLAVERDGGGSAAWPVDGQPDVQTLWSYADDGSCSVESIDFTSDSPNVTVERDGGMVAAHEQLQTWSTGCTAVQASIPVPAGTACATD
jgi:YD repeat-containing protein